MDRLTDLPPSVRSYLGGFATRWRRIVVLRAVGMALAALAVWVLLACVADRLFHLPSLVRLASLAGTTLLALAIGIRRLRPIRGPVDWVAMAGIIEEHDPRFNQALITVTSRVLGSPEHRGSEEILAHLLRDVERRAAEGNQSKILTLRSAAMPWVVLLVTASAVFGLSQIPQVGGPRLLARLVMPLADLPPVTTTELDVTPRSAEIMQSDPFRIEVRARRLGSSPVLIFINDEGDNWTQYPMDDAGSGRFAYIINTVGHDFRYKVRGGDAETEPFTVRVKRPPAVAEFRIRYTLPTYTGKPPFTVANTDGTIEAPAGSEVVLTIVATEPLQSALLRMGDEKLLMEKTADEHVRQTTLRFKKDTPFESHYELDLISTREVRGGGPSGMVMRATADRAPVVRLQQAGMVLHLSPRDVVPLSYSVIDDYGVVAVNLLAQVNGHALVQSPIAVPLHPGATRRRVEETVHFDLASMKLQIGDVVTLSLSARDTANKDAASEDELRILISPLSVDRDARERIDALTAAFNFVASVVEETDAAAKAIDQAGGQSNHQSSAWLSADASASRHLTSASEAATLLKQSLLRTAAHSHSPELSAALATWLDAAQQQAQTADDLFGRGDLADGMDKSARQRLRNSNAQARELLAQIGTAAHGERALAVLMDQINLDATRGAAPPGDAQAATPLAQVLELAAREIAGNEQEIGLDPAAADVEAQLRARVEAERAMLEVKKPLDFTMLVRQWVAELQRGPHQRTGLPQRLATAAQAEAVRGDREADMVRARDLDLCGRAMGTIESALNQSVRGKSVPQGAALGPMATAITSLQREQALMHSASAARPADEVRAIHAAAYRAREELARWTGENSPAKSTAPALRPGELEAMAMRVNADSTRHEYKRVAEEDRQLAQKLSDAAGKPASRVVDGDASPVATQVVEEHLQRIQQASDAIARHMSAADAIEKAALTQERLAQEFRSSKTAGREWASRQRSVADQIAAIARNQKALTATGPAQPVLDPNATTRPAPTPDAAKPPSPPAQWNRRAQAMTALLAAQEELALMKQQAALVQQLDAAHRRTADRAAALWHEVATIAPQRLRQAHRAADQADVDARDAADEFENALAPLMAAEDLADDLEPFALEAPAARDLIAGPLAAGLSQFITASDGADAATVSRAAGELQKTIEAARKELADAIRADAERDPLMAAEAFARAGADALSHHPPELSAAFAHQASAAQALSRAWENSVRRAGEVRLSELPSLQVVYGPPPPALRATPTANALSSKSASHDWSRTHRRESDDLAATLREPDPAGYEDQLKLYFEAMNKEQDKK
jgi:hypothetical protein